MARPIFLLALAGLFFSPGFTLPASAVPAGPVIAACDRMIEANGTDIASGGCNYSIDDGGWLTGCTKNVCFTCPPKGDCLSARKGTKPMKGVGPRLSIDQLAPTSN